MKYKTKTFAVRIGFSYSDITEEGAIAEVEQMIEEHLENKTAPGNPDYPITTIIEAVEKVCPL